MARRQHGENFDAIGRTGGIGHRAIAWEGAPLGIRVNAIAPGPIDTDLVRQNSAEWRAAFVARLPVGRFGTAEEIAATAVLLAGPHGGFYVGATLSPNGGDIMH